MRRQASEPFAGRAANRRRQAAAVYSGRKPPGVSCRSGGIETHPWNLTRLKPAEGARRSSQVPPRIFMIDFSTAYPSSRKVYEERVVPGVAGGHEMVLRVPMREVTLGGGQSPVRLYDTSGPQGQDVRT